ncbi:MAG: anhydro-N-acetylmuramic acid kinase [Planctomycetes bacterium]|nr:anhydro-N-acetylmuramic acid kinase [Planctomycetota bacterium]
MSDVSTPRQPETANPAAQASPRLVVGCMTGTSLDGLDATLVAITGHRLEMKAHYLGMVSRPLGALREELRHFASGGAAEPIRFLRAARTLGELHADAINDLLRESEIQNSKSEIAFAVAHGQTIWHAPGDRNASPDAGLSWQLFDPWPIVRRVGVSVCYDLRQADLIAGGQGAPITPMSDWVMYRKPDVTRVIVNLGGICNVTVIPRGGGPAAMTGGDIGPCNLLIDGVVRTLFPGHLYDEDGKISARMSYTGETMYRMIYGQSPLQSDEKPRSLGREQFTDTWVRDLALKARRYLPTEAPQPVFPRDMHDVAVLASAVESVAQRLAVYLRDVPGPYEVVLAGGGVRNKTLVNRIRAHVSGDVVVSDEIGVPCEAREAMGFAVLGALSQDGVPITLERVTGSKTPGRAGAWVYP